MSPSTILEEWHKEEEKAKELFQKYRDMASEKGVRLVFFQNEEIFVQLDELDELDSSITASLKHRKHSSVMVKVSDC